jgi:hypothetical protein
MKFIKTITENVSVDGTTRDGKKLPVNGGVSRSSSQGGLSLDEETFHEGHWLLIMFPRTEYGVVESVMIQFDHAGQVTQFLDEGSYNCEEGGGVIYNNYNS